MDSEESAGLAGQFVMVPESRQLDILAELLEARGARVLRLPLVTILDAPDPAPVLRWIHEFIDNPGDILILLTGEGLRRLHDLAVRSDCGDAFVAALSRTLKLCRGPKPGRALKELGLKPDLVGAAPTTAGIIATLKELDLAGKTVSVQLYGEEPNLPLMNFLLVSGATPRPVAPYVYASETDEGLVADFIRSLPAGAVTTVMFTSQPQYARLLSVAQKHSLTAELKQGLERVQVVAVGPVVADQLRSAGVRVGVMPESQFFMKPMVMALVRLLRDGPPDLPSSDTTPR